MWINSPIGIYRQRQFGQCRKMIYQRTGLLAAKSHSTDGLWITIDDHKQYIAVSVGNYDVGMLTADEARNFAEKLTEAASRLDERRTSPDAPTPRAA